MGKIMDKNELTKSLFPYMLEVSKTFKMSEGTKTALKGDAGELSLFDINVIEEFVNECIYRFIKDIKSVYTTADITREIILAYKLNGVGDDIKSFKEANTNNGTIAKSTDDVVPVNKSEYTGHTVSKKTSRVSFFDDDNSVVNPKVGIPHYSKTKRKVPSGYKRYPVTDTVTLYRNTDELIKNNPGVKKCHIYRISSMVPGFGEFRFVPAMYYISKNGNNRTVAVKSYRDYARKHYKNGCQLYKNSTSHVFGYSSSVLPAYRKN